MLTALRRPRAPAPGELKSNQLCNRSLGLTEPGLLRLLSFNIQVGINTGQYRHYLTRGWQHVLPNSHRAQNLWRIGRVLQDYDLVALQEVDGGSLRSGYINQVEHLAQVGEFPLWYQQLNRNLGRIAQHGNGLLTRIQPCSVEDHPLPGLLPGRGAIALRFGPAENGLVVIMLHLALGARGRNNQLGYVRELIGDYRHVVLMGDMNTHADELIHHSALADIQLTAPSETATFPSWRPQRCIDHILHSASLDVISVRVLDLPISDHLPVAVELRLPSDSPLQ